MSVLPSEVRETVREASAEIRDLFISLTLLALAYGLWWLVWALA